MVAARTLAQDAPVDPLQRAQQERVSELAQAEREVAVLPRVRVGSIRQLVQFSVEEGMLAARTTLSPVDGEVRVITPDLPGIVRLRVLDLPAVDDPSTGRNFTFMHNDLTQPGSTHAMTHVASIAGRLLVARDAESDQIQSSVQLIQDPPGTPVDADSQPVRLLVRISDNTGEAPKLDLILSASNFIELRRKYPREVEAYLRPLLREFRQDEAIFAVDPRVGWQVLGDSFQADAALIERIRAALTQFDSDDFRTREAAMQRLRQIGQPAALVLHNMDRSAFSSEQNAGVDAFLAEYLQLAPGDVTRLRGSTDFLLDTLACEDAQLRALAVEQLGKVVGRPIEFDPSASSEQRATQLQRLRDSLSSGAATRTTTK